VRLFKNFKRIENSNCEAMRQVFYAVHPNGCRHCLPRISKAEQAFAGFKRQSLLWVVGQSPTKKRERILNKNIQKGHFINKNSY